MLSDNQITGQVCACTHTNHIMLCTVQCTPVKLRYRRPAYSISELTVSTKMDRLVLDA